MNSRFLALFGAILVALAALWYFVAPTPAPAAPAAPSVAAPATAPAVSVAAPAPKPVAVPQVAAPKVAAVSTPASAVAAPVVDNQKELTTAIPELVHYIQAGDLVTAWQTYARPDFFAQIPPDRHAAVDERLRAVVTSPDGQMRVQIMSQVLDSFNTQTPVYNEAGDVATYQVAGPASAVGLKQVRFQKVDGRWYIGNDDLRQIGNLLGL